jgi:hypothetical protein
MLRNTYEIAKSAMFAPLLRFCGEYCNNWMVPQLAAVQGCWHTTEMKETCMNIGDCAWSMLKG